VNPEFTREKTLRNATKDDCTARMLLAVHGCPLQQK